MKDIKVIGCGDCPFYVVEYDDFSMGSDTLSMCNLSKYLKINTGIIESWDTKNEEEPYYTTKPDWCPLINTEIKITL